MKKVIIVDGDERDLTAVRSQIGKDYDVNSFSAFEFNNMALSTVISIANILDALDPFSAGRSLRIAVCARDLAKNLGWNERDCQNVYFISLLHDIGMLTVSEVIRNKPGRLDEDEYAAVKTHTIRGEQMLRDIDVVRNLSDGILYHHERWDGTGYPKGLAGKDIPAVARVIAVADAYDAMSSDRVYRSKLSTDKIISEFLRCKGGQFDPDIADVFIFMLKDGYTVDPKIEQTKEASERAVAQGGLRQVFASAFDERQETEGELDALTGLFTRSYLNTIVGKKITEERSGALMIIDIVGMPQLRSSLGDSKCDELIRKYTDKLRSYFREEDILCRIESDRFAVFVSGDSGKAVIEKKASVIAEMTGSDEELSKYKDSLKVDMGIAMCMEDGLTFEELYGSALSALEDAEKTGMSTYRFREV